MASKITTFDLALVQHKGSEFATNSSLQFIFALAQNKI